MSSSTHELAVLAGETWTEAGPDVQSLPPVDRGRKAWTFLTACFVLEALVWGFPFSYGVFQVYYSNHAPFSSHKTGIAAIGTTQTGIMYFSSPVVAIAMQRWPYLRRPTMCCAAVVMVVSLIAASFCNSVNGLLATQSVMYGLGGLTLYFPSVQFIDEWFVARKGIAYGIMWAGTGSAGVVVPFFLQWLLSAYGFRTALRVWAIVLAIGLCPCLFLVKGRLPTTSSAALRPHDLAFLKKGAFWLFEFGSVMQSLAFFLPALWIPSFSLSLGLPAFSGALGLALVNLTTCFGAIVVGLLVDRFHISVAILFSTVGQMLAIFVFWGLTGSQPMLYLFALFWGLFGGGFSATWSGYAGAMQRRDDNRHLNTGLIVALMAAGRGVGAVISGPLSVTLLEGESLIASDAKFAYGTSYGVLIVFAGVSALFGGAACFGRMLKLI